jgi:hypothetical protein
MEVFVPDHEAGRVLVLMRHLEGLGIQGRDAAYLASVDPQRSQDPVDRARYLDEFRYMVQPGQRAAAARLVGLGDYRDPAG